MDRHRSLDAPEISVVIPVYNVEQFLRACVESVLHQTFQEFEIILVDDGATDGCPALCDAYASEHEQIQVIHQKNGGLSAARNTGLSAARGKYIYFLDSDDWIVPHALQTLLDITKRENADAVLFEASVVNEAGTPIDHPYYTKYYHRKQAYETSRTGKQLFSELLANGDYLPAAPLMLMRRDAVTIPFAPILHEDELFTPQFLYTLERACVCGEALYVRRVRAESITSEKKTHRHFIGMATAARGLMQYPLADGTLKSYAGSLAISACGVYSKLSPADRAKAATEKELLLQELMKQHTPRASLAVAFFKMPFLYALYQLVKNA